MVNIMLDWLNLDYDYLREELSRYLKPHHRVAFVAFSFKDAEIRSPEDWELFYSREKGKYYETYKETFASVGIPMENVTFVNYFTDTPESAAEKIRNADVVYFPGGLPDRTMDRIRDFCLEEILRNFPGIMMGFSAGAMIQLAEFHVSPDDDYAEFFYYDGLPCVNDFYLEVHYVEENETQEQAIRQVLRERKKTVYATVEQKGAIIVDGGEIKLLGDVRRFEPENMEE